MCIFNRGDPTLVKTNVAITTGYLISGKRNTLFTQVIFVSETQGACTSSLMQTVLHLSVY